MGHRDWEALGEIVGPFGPGELEVREQRGEAGRQWQVRIRSRPNVFAVGIPDPMRSGLLDFDDADQVRQAIASSLRTKIPRRFDKDIGFLPNIFLF